ncbi:phosphoenolpyruvate carboxykinase (ATP) [Planctomycetota bacterium]
MADLKEKLYEMLKNHKKVKDNIPRSELIQDCVDNKEALVSANGALATWTPPESTGRRPKDTVIVKRKESEGTIDWNSPNNIPFDPELFDCLWDDALKIGAQKDQMYINDRVVGADPKYALPVKTIGDRALTMLFTDNMFRPVPEGIENSVLAKDGDFTLFVLPYDKIDSSKYEGKLRIAEDGKTADLVVAVDLDRRLGLVYGSAYGGSCKKLIFTVMNYLLPEKGILPLHCSANEGDDGSTALLLGLSGTGKTTLSADKHRALIGDDEHGWSDDGIANFENGCYAKLIDLDPEKEPEIHKATFSEKPYLEHGAIIENCLMWPNGTFNVYDDRLTPNSRVSYPTRFLTNVKLEGIGGHPKTILFLTADATGVLPPVSKLNKEQAKLWFMMGYTSKLAGTETGVVEPQATFSRFFGQPFMPRNPEDYTNLLGKKSDAHETAVYLINTGWTGGAHGVGQRMDINETRKMVHAALDGTLTDVEYVEDNRFHLSVPKSCPDVDPQILNPKNTWQDKDGFEKAADTLAAKFSAAFDKAYGKSNIDESIKKECPGK